MRPLVIGGSGFVGRAIAVRLLSRGYRVRATRRRTSNTLLLRKQPVEQAVASCDEPDALDAAMDGCDTVFFAAGHYPRTSVDPEAEVVVARTRARNVLDACRRAGIRRTVVTGSIATYGRAAPPADSAYHRVKHAIDAEVDRALHAGQDVVTVHAGGCLGEGDVKAATGYLIVGTAAGLLRQHVEGRAAFLDVDDAAEAHVRIAAASPDRRRWPLPGREVPIGDLLRAIAAALEVPFLSSPLPLDEAAALSLEQERRFVAREGPRPTLPREFVDIVRHWLPVDGAPVLEALGLTLTPLETTIRNACTWYARNGYLPTPHRRTA